MEKKLITKTNSVIDAPRRWHNNKEGFLFLQHLYHSGRKSQTLIINFKPTTYISLAVFVFLQLCTDRLANLFNTEILYFDGKDLINSLLYFEHLVKDNGENTKVTYFKKYSLYDEDAFKSDINDITKEVANKEIMNELQTNIFEIFINAVKHSGSNQNEKFSIYLGIIICNNKYKVAIANNGDFFSKEIKNKYGIIYETEYEYIKKALERGFSTKVDATGGLGLYVIEQFVKKYLGKLEIISGKGFFCNEFINDEFFGKKFIYCDDKSTDLKYPLPGTLAYFELINSDTFKNSQHTILIEDNFFNYFKEEI